MPAAPSARELEARAAASPARGAKAVLSRLTLWKEKGLTTEDVRDGMVSELRAWP